MKILAACLDRTGAYGRLRRAFEASARAVMPGVELEVIEIEGGAPATRRGKPDRKADINRSFLVTASAAWRSKVPVAVADLDLLFLRSIEDVWERPFDVAVTERTGRSPWNTGLWFMRPTEAARHFVSEWAALAHYFAEHEPDEVERHSGIDQAALARTLQRNREATVLRLPCREWNACQGEWASIDEGCRVLHVKSALRRSCLGGEPAPNGLDWAVELWHQYEARSAVA